MSDPSRVLSPPVALEPAMAKAVRDMPKTELHVHLEGTLAPQTAIRLGHRHDMDLSAIVDPNGRYIWKTFADFLKVYDLAAETVQTPEDYYDLMVDYYERAAAQGLIYGEMFISHEHPLKHGISYDTFTDTLNAAADDILAKFGVEIRFVLHVVRHYGVEQAQKVAELAEKSPKRRVTGIGIAGDEAFMEHKDFARVYERARGAGLRATAHAGEHLGPDSVRWALDDLKAERIGHGVRAIEDADLVKRLVDEGTTLEVCPSSNVCLDVNGCDDLAVHPFSQLHARGVKVTLNSDDPPFFFTTIGDEYARMAHHQKAPVSTLLDAARQGIHAGFCEDGVKAKCLARIAAFETELEAS